MTQKLLTEFVGTLLFLFSISAAVLSGTPMAPLAIGAALMVVVYMGGHVSGGHYNPAVSLAVLIRGKMTAGDLLPYWVAQVLGALTGCFLASQATGKSFAVMPGEGVTTLGAVLVEVVFTFALCLVVLNVATAKATAGNSYFGLAIGFTIVVAAFGGGPVSGGAFNPAVATGAAINSVIHGQGAGPLWMYWVGPLLGGVLAGGTFKLQNPGD
jgi:aquaporin Z